MQLIAAMELERGGVEGELAILLSAQKLAREGGAEKRGRTAVSRPQTTLTGRLAGGSSMVIHDRPGQNGRTGDW